jgi:hypothetical protein
MMNNVMQENKTEMLNLLESKLNTMPDEVLYEIINFADFSRLRWISRHTESQYGFEMSERDEMHDRDIGHRLDALDDFESLRGKLPVDFDYKKEREQYWEYLDEKYNSAD